MGVPDFLGNTQWYGKVLARGGSMLRVVLRVTDRKRAVRDAPSRRSYPKEPASLIYRSGSLTGAAVPPSIMLKGSVVDESKPGDSSLSTRLRVARR
jgi:hypothetical protein